VVKQCSSKARVSDVPDFRKISGKKFRAVSSFLQSKTDANIEAGIHRERYKGYDVYFRVVEVKKGKFAVYKFDAR